MNKTIRTIKPKNKKSKKHPWESGKPIKDMKSDSFDKDRRLRSPEAYAEAVLRDMPESALYSIEIKW